VAVAFEAVGFEEGLNRGGEAGALVLSGAGGGVGGEEEGSDDGGDA
jgi:hypothetical protein